MSEKRLLTPDEFKAQVLEITGENPFKWAKQNNLERWIVERVVKGKIPDAPNLIKLSNALGVSVDWLLTGEKKVPLKVAEEEAPYNIIPMLTTEEQEYVEKLLNVLRNPNTKKAIMENLDTFMKVPKPERPPEKKEGGSS